MTNHEQDFDPPRIILVKEVDGNLDFGSLPKDFRRFDSFQMLCAGVIVRSSEREFELLTSERFMLPAGTGNVAMNHWQQRAIGFIQAQCRAYFGNDFKLPEHQGQEEAFNEMMSHSMRNLGTEVMPEGEIKSLEQTLHHAFMAMLDSKMGLSTKKGLTGRYAMGGNV